MSRSKWKFVFVKDFLYKNTFLKKLSKNKRIIKRYVISNKATAIPNILLYSFLKIHKGNTTLNKRISKWMIGRKIGEFVFSKKPFYFPIKNKNKR